MKLQFYSTVTSRAVAFITYISGCFSPDLINCCQKFEVHFMFLLEGVFNLISCFMCINLSFYVSNLDILVSWLTVATVVVSYFLILLIYS